MEKGVYVIVDGGYHKWVSTMSASKNSVELDFIRFIVLNFSQTTSLLHPEDLIKGMSLSALVELQTERETEFRTRQRKLVTNYNERYRTDSTIWLRS